MHRPDCAALANEAACREMANELSCACGEEELHLARLGDGVWDLANHPPKFFVGVGLARLAARLSLTFE